LLLGFWRSNFEIPTAIERKSSCGLNVLDCRVTMDRSQAVEAVLQSKREAKNCILGFPSMSRWMAS